MYYKTLITNVMVVFGDKPNKRHDVLISGNFIARIENPNTIDPKMCNIVDGTHLYLFPGIISSQVHFREPGLTHKGNIYSESRAAVAGGVTSFMEMPNVNPSTTTYDLLEQKYAIAKNNSLANYSFFMGVTNDNYKEVMKFDARNVCGAKIFAGSSTGNMLVDNINSIEKVMRGRQDCIISMHCENDKIIAGNKERLIKEIGAGNLRPYHHPTIRNVEACYDSSSTMVKLAEETGARLHVLHISTAKEISLFRNDIPLEQKRVTAEACVHHLCFSDFDYAELGNLIVCNPAIKTVGDCQAVWNAVLNNFIDVVDFDHAPHTWDEKMETYLKAPSGIPLIQHGFNLMLEKYHQREISLQSIVKKMCNNQAILFNIEERGFIREGYFADLVLVDINNSHIVTKENILYKCGWSPFEGKKFNSVITDTFVNGHRAYSNGKLNDIKLGKRLLFKR